jgi:translation initiation factor 2 beta subunit (eIF-2beta)/eIF-5
VEDVLGTHFLSNYRHLPRSFRYNVPLLIKFDKIMFEHEENSEDYDEKYVVIPRCESLIVKHIICDGDPELAKPCPHLDVGNCSNID